MTAAVTDDSFGSEFTIRLNPSFDGNCQFVAISDQLQGAKQLIISQSDIRNRVMAHLHANQSTIDDKGLPMSLENYVTKDWNRYCDEMARDKTFGDHLTVLAAARIFNVQFLVISSLGVQATRLVTPAQNYDPCLSTLLIGHYAETGGG